MISKTQPTCSPAFSIPFISLICFSCPSIDFSHNFLTFFFFAFSFLLPRTSFHLSFIIITRRDEKQFAANCVIYRKVKNSLSSDYKHCFRRESCYGGAVSVGHICWPCVARVFVFISIHWMHFSSEFKVHKFWRKTFVQNFSYNFWANIYIMNAMGKKVLLSPSLCENLEVALRRLAAVGASMLHVAFASCNSWRLDAFLMSEWVRSEACALA